MTQTLRSGLTSAAAPRLLWSPKARNPQGFSTPGRAIQQQDREKQRRPVARNDRVLAALQGKKFLTSHFLRCQTMEEVDDRLDPAVEVRYVELLVGRVQIVVRQAQAHHH